MGRPSPGAMSPEPMCVRCTKFMGSPIMERSIRLLLFFGCGFSTTQQPSLCQKSLMLAAPSSFPPAGGCASAETPERSHSIGTGRGGPWHLVRVAKMAERYLQAASPQPWLWGCRAPPRLAHRTSARVVGGCKRGRCPLPGRELVATGLGRGRWATSPPHAQRIPSRLLRLRHRLRVRPSVPARVGAADSSAHGPPTAGAARGCIADPGTPADKSDAAVRCGCQHKERPASSPPSPRSLTMLDTISNQYDSFIYWRMPIPRLELAELEGLGLGEGPLYAPRTKLPGPREAAAQGSSAEEDSLLPFNSFNFWRAPIASISSLDFDLI